MKSAIYHSPYTISLRMACLTSIGGAGVGSLLKRTSAFMIVSCLAIAASAQTLRGSLFNYLDNYTRTDQKIKPSTLDSLKVDAGAHTVKVYVGGGFKEQFFTDSIVGRIYSDIRSFMPDSLADYDACIAIWERVIQELGRRCETSLAHHCFHAAVDCEYNKLYEKAFEYIERALEIYQKEGNLARYDILTLGLCQKIAANALTELGRYDEAEERLEKAEEILLEWSNMHENAGRTVTRNIFMGECNDIRDEIRKHRENEGKNTTQKSTT